MTEILYAKPVIDAELERLKSRTAKLKQNFNVTPTLKVVLVGNDPGSVIYTNSKKKFCEKIGADCEIIKLNENIQEDKFLEVVNSLNSNKSVHGVLIQLPLPKWSRTCSLYPKRDSYTCKALQFRFFYKKCSRYWSKPHRG